MSRSLDIEHGEWYSPKEATAHLPGFKDPKAVRELCINGDIEHVVKTGPNGAARYYISANAIRAWIRRHTVKVDKAA